MREQKVVGVGTSKGIILPSYERRLVKGWDGKSAMVNFIQLKDGRYLWTIEPIVV